MKKNRRLSGFREEPGRWQRFCAWFLSRPLCTCCGYCHHWDDDYYGLCWGCFRWVRRWAGKGGIVMCFPQMTTPPEEAVVTPLPVQPPNKILRFGRKEGWV